MEGTINMNKLDCYVLSLKKKTHMLERIFDQEDLKEKLESRFWWPELAKPG